MKLVLHKISKPKKPTPKDIANKIIKKERRRQLKANRKLKAEKKLKIVPIKIKGKIITEVENPKTKKQENKKIAENFFNNQITNLKDTKHFLDRQQERI